MALIHKLGNIEISEPIGFDALELSMERGEYHGMSVEASVGTLEFYGDAYDIIKQAYDTDIDTEVRYTATEDVDEVYSGVIDLSTCSFQESDYRSVSAKVAEIGPKTTFNNRISTEVDVDGTKTVDGSDIAHVPTWIDVHIPQKHLAYTNISAQKEDKTLTSQEIPTTAGVQLTLPFDDSEVNEFGNINTDGGIMFVESDDFDEKFGSDTMMEASGKIEITGTVQTFVPNLVFEIYLQITSASGNSVYASQLVTASWNPGVQTWNIATILNFKISNIPTAGGLKVRVLSVKLSGGTSGTYNLSVTIKPSEVKMVMYDNLPDVDVTSKMLPVYDALNTITEAISENELSVVSEWLMLPDQLSPSLPAGGGALKAITNGYKIRGLFSSEDVKRNLPVSFEKAIEAICATDCIGWGFSNDGGVLSVRIERWDWFYKSAIVATFNDVKEVRREFNADDVITEIKLGYQKYTTNDEYNSIDSIHGERTWMTKIKAVSNTEEFLCDWIADNYAIEETRRASYNVKSTEEFKYDESIFLFELAKRNMLPNPYFIPQSVVDSQNMPRPEEVINARLSPYFSALRWQSFLFRANSQSDMGFQVGTINYKASYGLENGSYEVLSTLGVSQHAENDPIGLSRSILMAETLSFECPVNRAQYASIKANPYGLVSVNGTLGWIKSVKYKPNDGTAEFKLIPKYEE